MQVLVLGGNRLGERIYWFLCGEADLEAVRFADGPTLPPLDGIDVVLSAGYKHILKVGTLAQGPTFINVHTGYLPWNRGMYPNVWPILDGTPAGVTIHRMDAGVDTGPILAQVRVPVEDWDTAASLYHRLEDAGVDLFKALWPERILSACGTPQQGPGTLHRKAELAAVTIGLDQRMTVREMLAVLRARTFPGYPGIRFPTADGHQWEVKVSCRKIVTPPPRSS